MKIQKLVLVDANSYLYRAYYALPALTTSSGMPTGAVYGFVTFISRILKEERPQYLAFCFDSAKPTFRSEQFPDYKIHRPKMPDDLRLQMDKIKEIIDAFGLKRFEYAGFEADDIIATLAKRFSEKGFSVQIITSDKDMLQLVGENIKIYNSQKSITIVDEKAVQEKFGIRPEKIVDFLALAGDKTDNIPGANGIGEKTAAKLISEFGSIENLLKNLDDIDSISLRNKLDEQRDNILLSKQLVTLNSQVPIKIAAKEIKLKRPDNIRLFKIYKELEFKSLLKDFQPPKATGEKSKSRQDCKDLKLVIEDAQREKELFLYYDEGQGFVALASSHYFSKAKTIDKKLKEILINKNVKKISNDLKAIKAMLLGKGVDLKGLYLDIRVAFYLLDSGRNDYSLGSLAIDYLNKIVDDKHLNIPEVFSLMDDLRFVQSELRAKNMDELFFDIEMPLLEVLADLEISGIKIDVRLLRSLSTKFDKELEKLKAEIFKLADKEFNINSPKQLSQVLFEELKLPVKKRKKSHASTDERVLNSLAADFPICQRILNYRQLMKLKTTYIDVFPSLIAGDGKIHTSFNQTGTQTGRLSTSSPNLQNIPVKTEIGAQIRRAFIPTKKNGLLLSADYSQIELKILAHLSGEQNLISAFKENIDIHKHTAALIFGSEPQAVDESMRTIAKRVNFGIIYGISSFGLARDLAIAQEEAEEFIENYFLRYPKVKEFMLSCIERTRRNGFVSTIMGRRRYLPAINSKNVQVRAFAERQAINMPVQGSAADLIKKAMLDIYREFKNRKFSSKMVLQVHDELVFDCVKNEISDIIPIVREKMEHAIKLSVPIKVSIKKGKNWLDMEEV